MKKVLAVETSCDDTSVAIVDHQGFVLALKSLNQDKIHEKFGGIVPEVAGRYHTEVLLPMIDDILKESKIEWKDIDGLAVTHRPGLVGSLLVGLLTVKTLALAKKIPFIGINHLEGHLLAPFLKDDQYSPPKDFTYPYIALAVSGGHTSLYTIKDFGSYELLGVSVDDAAGEAFDKFGKLLGLGFPGGVKVDELSKMGRPDFYKFPRAMIGQNQLNMSFSGLKTAGLHQLQSMSEQEIKDRLPDLCASFQEAIVDTLLMKLEIAVKKTKINKVVITGGVSANSRLRAKGAEWAKNNKCAIVIPPLRYCTDNAAMIGYAGIKRLMKGEKSPLSLSAMPDVSFEEFACTS